MAWQYPFRTADEGELRLQYDPARNRPRRWFEARARIDPVYGVLPPEHNIERMVADDLSIPISAPTGDYRTVRAAAISPT